MGSNDDAAGSADAENFREPLLREQAINGHRQRGETVGWVRKDRQRQGVGRQLTEHRIKKVIEVDGRVVQLMTKDTGFFGRWFTVSRDYHGEGWKLMTLQLGTVAL